MAPGAAGGLLNKKKKFITGRQEARGGERLGLSSLVGALCEDGRYVAGMLIGRGTKCRTE